MPDYLLKRGSLWWVQRKFPVDVKDRLGTLYRKSLGTTDHSEAKKKVAAHLQEFDALVAKVRMARDRGDLFAQPENVPTLAEMLALYQNQVLSGISNAAAQRHQRVLTAFGQLVGLERRADQLPNVARQVVEEWLIPEFGHTEAGRRALNVLVAFVDWVIQQGYLAPPNLFAGWRIKPIKSVTVARKAWSQEALSLVLEALVSEAEKPVNVLARDNAWRLAWVVLLGHTTGQTLHEICEAERRVHFKELPAEWHRVRSQWPEIDPFWVPGLSAGGPDLRRSWHLQKALGRRLKGLGAGLTYTGLRHASSQGVPLDYPPWLARLQAVPLGEEVA